MRREKFIALIDNYECLHYVSVSGISHLVECSGYDRREEHFTGTRIIFKDQSCFNVKASIEEVRRILEKCGYFKLVKIPRKGNKDVEEMEKQCGETFGEIKKIVKELDKLYCDENFESEEDKQ